MGKILTLTIIISSVLIWGINPQSQWVVYGILILAGALVIKFTEYSQKPRPQRPQNTAEVISLDEYRKKKQEARNNSTFPAWVPVLASTSVIEAELVSGFLETEGIETRILNKQQASILIHPVDALEIKVLVKPSDERKAKDLIKNRQDQNVPSGPL
ncbi:MAG: DUF2007 domain-containing protein [SAR324 cluster bacterium]|nr:DUF2007 domain-containing protein [SAR324 cluster bacterium]